MYRRLWILATLLSLQAGVALAEDDAGAPDEGNQGQTASAEGTGAGGDAAAPAKPDAAPDFAALRDAFDQLMDDMVTARGRIASLGKALFKTRLSLWVDHRADAQKLTSLRLLVDGAPVYDSDGKELRGGDSVQLFDGAVAAGTHELRVEYGHRSRERDTYTYSVSQRFTFEVREGTRTEVTIRIDDDSDIAEELPEGDEGTYEVRTRVVVNPVPLED